MSHEKLAAIELTKLIAGLRSGPPMTDQDAFKLYRECLAVIREPGAVPEAAETDPSKVALGVLSVLRGAAQAVGLTSSPPAAEAKRPTPRARRSSPRRRGGPRRSE